MPPGAAPLAAAATTPMTGTANSARVLWREVMVFWLGMVRFMSSASRRPGLLSIRAMTQPARRIT
jgi:hypothetical protein